MIKIIKMSGLRVYIKPAAAGIVGEPGEFYSRRAGGPCYRWCYEEGAGCWRCSREQPRFLSIKALCAANWKTVPPALRERLDEHYP
ncbi:MAG: hypothetical protein ACRD68_15305 [Pyrinomonadaceae bacterium]